LLGACHFLVVQISTKKVYPWTTLEPKGMTLNSLHNYTWILFQPDCRSWRVLLDSTPCTGDETLQHIHVIIGFNKELRITSGQATRYTSVLRPSLVSIMLNEDGKKKGVYRFKPLNCWAHNEFQADILVQYI